MSNVIISVQNIMIIEKQTFFFWVIDGVYFMCNHVTNFIYIACFFPGVFDGNSFFLLLPLHQKYLPIKLFSLDWCYLIFSIAVFFFLI